MPNNLSFKKIALIVVGLLTIGVVGYVSWYVYDHIAQSIIEKKIKEAGLNPADYDLSGVAPWNIRDFVTNKEIEKAGLNPADYDIKGAPTAKEARLEVIRQEISRQLAEYDLTIDDVDLSDVDLISLTSKEISDLVYKKAYQKVRERSAP